MNAENYLILAYVLGLGIVWGYAVLMWRESRGIAIHERARAPGARAGDGGLS
jgi:hypothetical protein